MAFGRIALAASLILASLSGPRARSVTDGSATAIGAESAAAVLALIEKHLRSPEARATALRRGRAGAPCGAVEVRNRMGTCTGPRGFVAEFSDGFLGRLPEGPELRNPASAADDRAMERAKTLFTENGIDG